MEATGEVTKIISGYTSVDFLESSEPYDLLYSLRSDKFRMAQCRELLKRQAAAVGVRGFNGLWQSFLETKNAREVVPLDQVTEFTGQPLELFCGGYCCDDNGVTIPDRYGDDQVVCLHPIMPVRRLINTETGAQRMEIAYCQGGAWRSMVVDKITIANAQSIISLAGHGVCVNSENARALSSYLMQVEQLNEDVIPVENCVSHMGWTEDGLFAPYDPQLGFDADQGFGRLRKSIRQAGSYDEWLRAMGDLRSRGGPGRFFLAASFASVLVGPLGVLPFFLHAYGGSEFGKTVGLMAAASVWGDPNLGEFVTTFDATQVGMERIAGFLYSLPMCIDELQIKESLGERDFDKIIYHLGEGVGRARSTRDGGLQERGKWRNCIISTGERPITNTGSKGGAINRSVEIEIAERLHPDLPGLANTLKANFGHAGPAFVELLRQGGMDLVRIQYEAFYERLKKSPATDKQAAAGALLMAADALASNAIFRDGNCLDFPDLLRILSTKADVDVNAKALAFIRELPSRYPARFEVNKFNEWTGERWGKVQDGFIFILRGAFNDILTDAGFNVTTFLSWADRQGLLLTAAGRRDKTVRSGGKVERFIVIREEDSESVTT